MPHSDHSKRSSEPQTQKHHESKSTRQNKEQRHKAKSQSKESKESKEVVKSSTAKGGQKAQQQPPPVEQSRPWSEWFPGDNGKWFWQARLKADGSGWDYQFTGGYPSSTRRDRIGYGSLDTETSCYEAPQTTTVSYANTTQPAVTTMSAPTVQPPAVTAVTGSDDADDDTSLATEEVLTTVTVPYEYQTYNISTEQQPRLVVATLPVALAGSRSRTRHTTKTIRTNTPAPHRPSKKSHSGSRAATATETRSIKAPSSSKQNKKKLSAIINSEKELRFNSKKKVKGWLSEVGD